MEKIEFNDSKHVEFLDNSTIFVQKTKYSISFALKLLRLFFISVQNVKNTRKLMEVKIPNKKKIINEPNFETCKEQ